MTNPWPTRRFGVEIEVSQYRDPERMAAELEEHLRLNRYRTQVRPWDGGIRTWVVKEDGSCGGEFATPALTWERADELKLVFDWIKAKRYTAGSACGMHVHHDFPNATTRQLRQIMVAWSAYQQVLNMLVLPRRIHNDFCHQLPCVRDLYPSLIPSNRGIRSFYDDRGRYFGMNAGAWWRTGTVEIRLHHGTVEFDTMRTWVLLCQLMFQWWMDDDIHPRRHWERVAALSLKQRATEVLTVVRDTQPSDINILKALRYRMKKWYSTVYTANNLEEIYAAL